MKKEARIYRLPTEQAEKCVTIAHRQMMLSPGLVTSGGDIQAFHLYITTDEDEFDIDEYVLFIGADMPKVFKVKAISQDYLEDSKGTTYDPDYCEKIIATTDPKLNKPNSIQYGNMLLLDTNGDGSHYTYKEETEFSLSSLDCIQRRLILPQIPQSFIEEYCKAGGIDEVLVEYDCSLKVKKGDVVKFNSYMPSTLKDYAGIEGIVRYGFEAKDKFTLEKINHTLRVDFINKHGKECDLHAGWMHWYDSIKDRIKHFPKLDSNNCIIIHPVEENKFEKQKTYILRRLEHCNKRLKQCEEKYNGKEEKHTFHGGRDLGYWQGLVEGYTLQLEWIEENI